MNRSLKDHLSSTRQVGVERRELELELEGMRCLGSILTGGNIFSQDFCFHIVKSLIPILVLLPTLQNDENT